MKANWCRRCRRKTANSDTSSRVWLPYKLVCGWTIDRAGLWHSFRKIECVFNATPREKWMKFEEKTESDLMKMRITNNLNVMWNGYDCFLHYNNELSAGIIRRKSTIFGIHLFARAFKWKHLCQRSSMCFHFRAMPRSGKCEWHHFHHVFYVTREWKKEQTPRKKKTQSTSQHTRVMSKWCCSQRNDDALHESAGKQSS